MTDDAFAGAQLLRIVELEIRTDHIMEMVVTLTCTTYGPLAQARREQWLGREVRVIPSVISRTSTPHKLAIKHMKQLIPTRADPGGGYCPPKIHVHTHGATVAHTYPSFQKSSTAPAVDTLAKHTGKRKASG